MVNRVKRRHCVKKSKQRHMTIVDGVIEVPRCQWNGIGMRRSSGPSVSVDKNEKISRSLGTNGIRMRKSSGPSVPVNMDEEIFRTLGASGMRMRRSSGPSMPVE